MSFGFVLALQKKAGVPRGYERDAIDLLICMNGSQSPLSAPDYVYNTTGTTSTADLSTAALYYSTSSTLHLGCRQGSSSIARQVLSANSLGYVYKGMVVDSVYRLHFVFDHSQPTLALKFMASGLQRLADESWGIDNVSVTVE